MAIESFPPISVPYPPAAQQLTSGSRINHSADDAAGQAIVTALTSQINGQDIATRNANDGISLIQTADSASANINEQLQNLSSLSTRASNGTFNDSQRAVFDIEYQQGLQNIERLAQTSSFNGINLLNGDNSNISIGLDSSSSNISLPDLTLGSLGLAGSSITNSASITNTQDLLGTALQSLSDSQSLFGSQQNGLASAVEQLSRANINTLSSRSQISDADMAKAFSELARQNVLNQSSIAMQAQSNFSEPNVLSLLTL